MGQFKTSFATERVRRYLLQKILRGGSQPTRLPTERELTELLGLSRVTVRRAIADLEAGRYILRFPEKQGIFTNPAMSEITLHSIGIICSSNYVSNREMLLLGAMGDELMARKCFYSLNFFMLHDAGEEELANELRNSGFDCMVSFEPSELTESLLARDLPLLVVEYFGYPRRSSRNFFGTDGEAAGRSVASAIIASGCGRVLFCGDHPEMREGFKQAAGNRIAIDFTDGNERDRKLYDLLKTNCYDGVAAMMREVGLRRLYDALNELELPHQPKLFLYPWPEAELFRNSNPQYDTEVFDTEYFQMQLKKLGRAMAEGVIRTIAGQPVPNTLVNPIRN